MEDGGNLILCTASSGDTPSYESEDLKHGIFTAAWRGRGWARWVIAALVLLAIAVVAGMWAFLPRPPVFPWQTSAAFVIRMTFYITAIALLFSPTANAWYREMKRWR